MIKRNKHYQLAGQDRLKISSDLHTIEERVKRANDVLAELAAA
jgi:hypothetical protein